MAWEKQKYIRSHIMIRQELESGLDIWKKEHGIALVRAKNLDDQMRAEFPAFRQNDMLFRTFNENADVAFGVYPVWWTPAD
jgi:hypothetical protein